MSEPKVVAVYKLVDPIPHGPTVITEIEFIKPTLKHFRELDHTTGNIERLGKLVEICGRQPEPVVDQLSIADIAGITEILAPFLG